MGAPSAGTVVWRGLRRRCGRCGERAIFRSYFRLRERCPRCGYRFVREEGAFTGVMLMNMVLTFGLMWGALVTYVLWRGVTGDSDLALWPFGVAAAVLAVVGPAIFYPVAASWWAAIDLAMRPLDPAEEADASAHREISG
ncbi:MAG TPA: DUF983 domain-containing protein [Baekduia sp.]|nr:DUF983 domain-containing protein [Baekduia sp.]